MHHKKSFSGSPRHSYLAQLLVPLYAFPYSLRDFVVNAAHLFVEKSADIPHLL